MGMIVGWRSLTRPLVLAALGVVAGNLVSCANTPVGEQVERSLAADPRLTDEQGRSRPQDSSLSASRPSNSYPLAPPTLPAPVDPAAVDVAAERLGLQFSLPSDRGAVVQPFVDISDAPDDLQPYVLDLAALEILTAADGAIADDAAENAAGERANEPQNSATVGDDQSASSGVGDGAGQVGEAMVTAGERDRQFNPNQPIRRRDFARWLLTANNALFSDRPGHRLRLGSSGQPAFQDVPPSDPDFAIIQGLAEAGIITSPLSGQVAAVNFRPDAPLTRETMLRWKVPLDYRQSLPVASVAAVEETWGFQDAAQIDPEALPAVLADYQNGDASNIRRALGYTTLLQPKQVVTRAEAAAVVWYFGYQGDGRSAQQLRSAQSVAQSVATDDALHSELGTRLGAAIAPMMSEL
jgi:hypothetical protein